MSALSRRNVLGVVAAVPAMALLPASLTVASPEVGATVFDLANRALQTWRELDAACSRLSRSKSPFEKSVQWTILRKRRLPSAMWIMASETSMRSS
jgi:hypothetical protein